jgi:hypothetical protein
MCATSWDLPAVNPSVTDDDRDANRRAVVVSGLLAGCAAGAAVDALGALVVVGRVGQATERFRDIANAGSEVSASIVSSVRVSVLYNLVVAVLAVAALGWRALSVRRRTRPARGGTWLAAAVFSWALVAGTVIGPEVAASPDANRSASLNAAVEWLLPTWYSLTHSVLAGGVIVAVIAAAVLLARISALDFHRAAPRAVR